jgi:pilus assembly protein Flp/PilA
MRLLRSLFRDVNGATAVEYGLLAGIIGITLAVALGNYYEVMNNMFTGLANTFENSTSR